MQGLEEPGPNSTPAAEPDRALSAQSLSFPSITGQHLRHQVLEVGVKLTHRLSLVCAGLGDALTRWPLGSS